MEYLVIAKIINTHGIKGEVKVLCNFYGNNYRNWKANQTIFIENNHDYQPLIINTIRRHKNYLLITFKNYHDINEVMFLKNKSVKISNDMADDANLWFVESLIGYQAVNNKNHEQLGKIVNLIDNNHSGLWEIIDNKDKIHYVPNNKNFINKVDKINKIVYLNLISGMFDYE